MKVDVVIITALLDEYNVVKSVEAGAVDDWSSHRDSAGFRYETRVFRSSGGDSMRVALARPVDSSKRRTAPKRDGRRIRLTSPRRFHNVRPGTSR